MEAKPVKETEVSGTVPHSGRGGAAQCWLRHTGRVTMTPCTGGGARDEAETAAFTAVGDQHGHVASFQLPMILGSSGILKLVSLS